VNRIEKLQRNAICTILLVPRPTLRPTVLARARPERTSSGRGICLTRLNLVGFPQAIAGQGVGERRARVLEIVGIEDIDLQSISAYGFCTPVIAPFASRCTIENSRMTKASLAGFVLVTTCVIWLATLRPQRRNAQGFLCVFCELCV